MQTPLQITIGSTDNSEIDAVLIACRKLEIMASIIGVKAITDEAVLGSSLVETYYKAELRADNVQSQKPFDICIGIQYGIAHIINEILEITMVVIIREGKPKIAAQFGYIKPNMNEVDYTIAKKETLIESLIFALKQL